MYHCTGEVGSEVDGVYMQVVCRCSLRCGNEVAGFQVRGVRSTDCETMFSGGKL